MSKQPHILEGESVAEFDALSASLHSQFAPTTETERLLVDMLVHHEWLMRRALRMQQQLTAAAGDESKVDPKRMHVVVRYFRTHERAYAQTKRELESIRKFKRKVATAATRDQRQWEQILKKMPTLTNWVN